MSYQKKDFSNVEFFDLSPYWEELKILADKREKKRRYESTKSFREGGSQVSYPRR